MALWEIRRTDAPHLWEVAVVQVSAPDKESALRLVCGGPSKDYPDIVFFGTNPFPGFREDQKNARIREVASE